MTGPYCAAKPTQRPSAALAGDTWNFQAWYRDTSSGAATSNFKRALAIAIH